MTQEIWQIQGSLQLGETLRVTVPRERSLLRVQGNSAVYTLWTESGPATVSLTCTGDELRADALGPGAEGALASVPRTVGIDDRPESFQPASGAIRELHRRSPGLRLGSTGRVFDAMLRMIVGQRVTTNEARRSYSRLVEMTGQPAPGETGLLLPPLPAAVLRLDQGDYHRAGIENARARVIRGIARHASRLEEITTMDRELARARLEAVSGVGRWTSAQVMGAAWGDRDAVPFGDFHLPNMVSWALAGEPRGTDERMAELLEPYRPHRRRALLLLKMSGIHAPRYGPRSATSIIGRDF